MTAKHESENFDWKLDARFIKDGVLCLPPHLIDYHTRLFIDGADGCGDIVTLGNLRSVKGGLYIKDCPSLVSLGSLMYLDGPLDCNGCPNLSDMGSLRRAKGFVNVAGTAITDLDNLVVDTIPGLDWLKPLKIISNCAPEPG